MKKCTRCNIEKEEYEFHKRAASIDGLRPTCKACRQELNKQYYKQNSKRIIENVSKWNQENKEHRNAYIRAYRKERRKKDPKFKLYRQLQCRLNHALNGSLKAAKTMELVGCTLEELKTYLESKFLEGMSWDNHGHFGWHIDHIKPCASFDLTKDEEQRKCFHYTNLQPLWWKDNLNKSQKSP